MSCGAELSAAVPELRRREPARRQVLHRVRGRADSRRPRRGTRRPAAPLAEAPPEERRQATVLFADLSGYTAAAERMDPEAVKALVDRTLRRLGEEIERFGGSIDKFIGDNVMGVFGAPVAHEDDPERAVRAGLAMQDAMEEANRQSREKIRRRLLAAGRDQLRRGDGGRRRRPLHGDGRRRSTSPPGSRPPARPDSVTVGETTYRATRRGDLLRAARAADAEGQGGAGPGLGGDRRALPSRGAAPAAPRRR